MSPSTKKLLSCPVCDTEDLGLVGGARQDTVSYRCRECNFIFKVDRTELVKAGVIAPAWKRAKNAGSFERAKPIAQARVSVSSAQYGSGR
jgi:transposase-like protein